jgi:hypothetical protein
VLFRSRPATDVAKVNSICVDDSGDIVAVAGTDGSTAAFSETRAAAGGPPLIPVGYVELAQVRVTLAADSVITEDQIYDSPGVHSERAMMPAYKEPNCVGDGIDAETTAQVDAYLEFDSALPKIHTGAIPKAIYIKVYTPILSEVSRVMDYVPAEISHSANSEEYYGGAIASISKSLGQCSFSGFMNNGIDDPILRQKNQVVIVEYYQDRDQSAKIVQQGTLGIKRTFPVSGQIKADFTLTTTTYPSADFTE